MRVDGRTRGGAQIFPVAALLVSLVVCGCDPGLHLEPVGWKSSGEFDWELESNGLRFRIGSLGGLIGSTSQSFEITVHNKTPEAVVIEGAVLETSGRMYKASFPGHGERKSRSVGPGAVERFNLHWVFDDSLHEVFGDSAIVHIAFRVGDEDDTLRIEFKREAS